MAERRRRRANVISGNDWVGVLIQGSGATGNLVQGNYIGTDVNGMADLGNAQDGVGVFGAPGNIIGGSAAGAGNLISGNDSEGVAIEGLNATGNVVQGNLIGSSQSGSQPLANTSIGVLINNSSGNTIGGSSTGEGNRIAFNSNRGVVVIGSSANAILANSISSNAGLGIDLASDGVTDNDPNDADSGANSLQNYPVLGSVEYVLQNVTIGGTLNSTPNNSFRVEFFANSSCDGTGFGEGETYLGFTTVMTGSDGSQTLQVTLPAPNVFGQQISATATDPGGNTSEFSRCDLVIPSLDLDGDGIADELDLAPGSVSEAFSDISLGGTTSGHISDPGDQLLKIVEEANPSGVTIVADASGGAATATIIACSGDSVRSLDAGDEVVLTCGSTSISVVNGAIEATFLADDGTIATTVLNEGNEVTFEQQPRNSRCR